MATSIEGYSRRAAADARPGAPRRDCGADSSSGSYVVKEEPLLTAHQMMQQTRGTLKVLVVEESEFQRHHCQTLFQVANRAHEKSGSCIRFSCTPVAHMEAFIWMVRKKSADWDLVLLTVSSSNYNEDLLPSVRKMLPSTPILMMSSEPSTALVERCIHQGANGYLPKPLNLDTVKLIWQHCVVTCSPRPSPKSSPKPCVPRHSAPAILAPASPLPSSRQPPWPPQP